VFANAFIAKQKVESSNMKSQVQVMITGLVNHAARLKVAVVKDTWRSSMKAKFSFMADADLDSIKRQVGNLIFTNVAADMTTLQNDLVNSWDTCFSGLLQLRREMLCLRCSGRASTFWNPAKSSWNTDITTCYTNATPCLKVFRFFTNVDLVERFSAMFRCAL